jgi:hypothetical protein
VYTGYILAVFASPSASDLYPGNPASGNISTPACSAGNMAVYENLTTPITPLMAIMFPDRTVDAAASSNVPLSSVQHGLICLRSSDISVGSGQHQYPITGHKGDFPLGWLLFVAILAMRL